MRTLVGGAGESPIKNQFKMQIAILIQSKVYI